MPETIIPKVPEPANGYPRKQLSDGQVYRAAVMAGWPSGDPTRGNSEIVKAVAIALAESGGNMVAHNKIPPDDSYGLWQINMLGQMGQDRIKQFNIGKKNDLYDPVTNAKAALTIRREQGWSAWSVYTSGKYLGYLARARKAANNQSEPPRWQSPFNDVGGIYQGEAPGAALLDSLFQPLIDFVSAMGIRVAGFLGGAALLIGAIILIAKRGIK